VVKRAPRLGRRRRILVNLSGRGDKDLDSVGAFLDEEAATAARGGES